MTTHLSIRNATVMAAEAAEVLLSKAGFLDGPEVPASHGTWGMLRWSCERKLCLRPTDDQAIHITAITGLDFTDEDSFEVLLAQELDLSPVGSANRLRFQLGTGWRLVGLLGESAAIDVCVI